MSRTEEYDYYRKVARNLERIGDYLEGRGEKDLANDAITAAVELKTVYAKYDSMRSRVNELMGNANVD
jgi:hypothetical protein